jgi:hypothetical protein
MVHETEIRRHQSSGPLSLTQSKPRSRRSAQDTRPAAVRGTHTALPFSIAEVFELTCDDNINLVRGFLRYNHIKRLRGFVTFGIRRPVSPSVERAISWNPLLRAGCNGSGLELRGNARSFGRADCVSTIAHEVPPVRGILRYKGSPADSTIIPDFGSATGHHFRVNSDLLYRGKSTSRSAKKPPGQGAPKSPSGVTGRCLTIDPFAVGSTPQGYRPVARASFQAQVVSSFPHGAECAELALMCVSSRNVFFRRRSRLDE